MTRPKYSDLGVVQPVQKGWVSATLHAFTSSAPVHCDHCSKVIHEDEIFTRSELAHKHEKFSRFRLCYECRPFYRVGMEA